MRNSELLLFFFIIYSQILVFVVLYMYYNFKEVIDSKDDYIEKLKFQLANYIKK